MSTLYKVGRRNGHIVTQVVETEFIVGTECDICLISLATLLRVRLMLIDTIHAQSVEHIERSHPLRVTLGQIVVHRYYVNTITRQCIQEYRQRSHEGLTFTRCHLGNLTLMQNNTTKQLYVVVYHFPFQVVATCRPMVVVDGLVAIDGDKVLAGVCSQLAVEIGSGNNRFLVLSETSGCLFHDRENLGHHLVQRLFVDLQHFLLQFVYLGEDVGTLIDRCIFDGCFQFLNLFFLFQGRVLHLALNVLGALAQLVVVQLLYFRVDCFHFLYQRLNKLHVTRRLIAKQRA